MTNHYLATIAQDEHGLTITPFSSGPVLRANAEPNITVAPGLKRLLDKAGLQPPPPGQHLSIGHVNEQLSKAQMSVDERLEVKAALTRLNMVEMGKPVNFFQ